MALFEEIEKYTYAYLMQLALNYAPSNIDKREGSVLYDAVAPVCMELAEIFLILRQVIENFSISTASGEYLELKAQEVGLTRREATPAIKRGVFKNTSGDFMNVPIGSRWSTITTANPQIYRVIENVKEGESLLVGNFLLQAETAGTIGHTYTGNINPIDFIQGVGEAVLTDTIRPGEDVETDEELRTRYFDTVGIKPFGGNFKDYKERVLNIAGVGAVQIFPLWNGGGTVKISVIDSTFMMCTTEFIAQVQDEIDPTPQSMGYGLAPIGHTVTVVTPTERKINITLNAVLQQGVTAASIQTEVENVIEAHFAQLRHNWGNESASYTYSLTLYRSSIIAVVVAIPGVIGVTRVLLNNIDQDITFPETAIRQELPTKGTVVVNA